MALGLVFAGSAVGATYVTRAPGPFITSGVGLVIYGAPRERLLKIIATREPGIHSPLRRNLLANPRFKPDNDVWHPTDGAYSTTEIRRGDNETLYALRPTTDLSLEQRVDVSSIDIEGTYVIATLESRGTQRDGLEVVLTCEYRDGAVQILGNKFHRGNGDWQQLTAASRLLPDRKPHWLSFRILLRPQSEDYSVQFGSVSLECW